MGFNGELMFRDPREGFSRVMFLGLRAAAQQIQASRSLLGAGEPQPNPYAGLIGGLGARGAATEDEYTERLLEPVATVEPPPPPPPSAQVDLTASDYESLLAVSTPRRAPMPPPEEQPRATSDFHLYEVGNDDPFDDLERDPWGVSLLDPRR